MTTIYDVELLKFGDILENVYGHPYKMVFLCKERKGIFVFGTENGGYIRIQGKELANLLKMKKWVLYE